MDYQNWPQWLVMGHLLLPMIVWPIFRLSGLTLSGGRRKNDQEWAGAYVGMLIRSSFFAWALYMGGFWS